MSAAVELAPVPTPADAQPLSKNASPSSSTSPSSLSPSAYNGFLGALRRAWSDAPDVTISFGSLRVEHRVDLAPEQLMAGCSKHAHELPTLPRTILRSFAGLDPRNWGAEAQAARTSTLASVASASGVIRPGELTLLLGPPGSGRSSLLRALAGRLTGPEAQPHLNGIVRGDLRWNGLDAEELARKGVQLRKLTALVDQADTHYPMLTVRETLTFAAEHSMADTGLLGSAELNEQRAKLVDSVMQMMGLSECADTIVGSPAVRGVSGGQRRRVSVAEMLMGNPRVLCLDECTSGLDASTAFDLCSAIAQWATVMRGSATMALQQPAPEIVDLFHRIVLMSNGHVVFSGTQAELRAYVKEVTGAELPAGRPIADWALHYLGQAQVCPSSSSLVDKANDTASKAAVQPVPSVLPEVSAVRFHVVEEEDEETASQEDGSKPAAALTVAAGAMPIAQLAAAVGGVTHSSESPAVSAPVRQHQLLRAQSSASAVPPMSSEELVRAWQGSKLHTSIERDVEATRTQSAGFGSAADASAFTRAQFWQPSCHSFWHHMRVLLLREWRAVVRNEEVIWYRVLQAIVMGLILGSLFFDMGKEASDVFLRLGLIFLLVLLIAFGSVAEVPSMIEFKNVVLKQSDAGFYPSQPYVLGVALTSFPLTMLESALLGVLVYFMTSFAMDAGRFFFVLLVMMFTSLSLNSFYRVITYSVPSQEVAIAIANPVTGVLIMFSGFFITREKIPNWLIWCYWFNPFPWPVNSLALNEYHSSDYTDAEADQFLGLFEIPKDDAYRWGGVAFLAGWFVMCSMLAALQLHRYRGSGYTRGARRAEALVEERDAETVRIAVKEQEDAADALPFERATLTWSNVGYTIEVDADAAAPDAPAQGAAADAGKKTKVQRKLLTDISGYAKPGTVTALMGASGAGKTTLLDVLASRKTSGVVTGSILINGAAPTIATRGLLGFGQQSDEHFGLATVREAVDFAAYLRLPASVSAETRSAFVSSILRDLELDALADRLVGDPTGDVAGLAPGERKRLTIAVELASNPPILFLDEPTTGLDARSALVVMRVVRKIASRGRSVICTIHQPSAELFLLFDRLLLLQSGGRAVYFGDVGPRGSSVVEYFSGLPLQGDAAIQAPAADLDVNVAVWMLDAIRANVPEGQEVVVQTPFAQLYNDSALCKKNDEARNALVPQAAAPASNGTAEAGVELAAAPEVYMRSTRDQFAAVMSRMWTTYWRSGPLQYSKFIACIFLGIVLGVVYYKISEDDESGMQSKVAALFSLVIFAPMILGSAAVPPMFATREAFYRETTSNTYRPWLHAVAATLVEQPFNIVGVILLAAPSYWMIDYRHDAGAFFEYLLMIYTLGVVLVSLNQLFCAISPVAAVAIMLSDLTITLLILFAGLIIKKEDIPIGWQWMYHLNPMPKGFVAVVLPQWVCDEATGEGNGCGLVDTLDKGLITKEQYALDFVASDQPWQWYYFLWMIFSALVIQGAFLYATQKVSFRSR